MIVAVVATNNLKQMEQLVQAIPYPVDLLELRLDYLPEINLVDLKSVLKHSRYPLIFTLRPIEQGGHFQLSEIERLNLLKQLGTLAPDYIDFESSIDGRFISEFAAANPMIKIIRSYHNFTETPQDLHGILADMQHPAVAIYKLVTFANNALDNFRLLHFLKELRHEKQMTVHAMGEHGFVSRIIGAIMGNVLQYATIDECQSPAPGCPNLAALFDVYRMHLINRDTRVFALLGDPVAHSIGHLFHNKKFAENNWNARYVKIQLKTHDMAEFFQQLPGLPFAGFSVTTPHKQTVLNYLDKIDASGQAIGAVNTVLLKDGHQYATNTDGLAVVDAIEALRPIKGSRVLIIGAGGAAKAIAYEIHLKQPLALLIVNRTLAKAKELAQNVQASACDFSSFATLGKQFDVIINTVPNTTESDAAVLQLIKPMVNAKTLVMNIDYSHPESIFLSQIKAETKCFIIDPRVMFTNQALRQIQFWFSH